MELIEIRNNLIKLSYNEDEKPTLGQFIALTAEDKSFVAQYVNLKADNIHNFAVAKLMFSFNSAGVVSEYDGSTPSINANIINLPANELLDLLPIETPIQIGKIVSTNEILNTDISIFEHNFTVFCEHDFEKTTMISNCVRQLFRMKEKSIIIDNDALFADFPKIKLGQDFKLPLNSDFIDFVFDYELRETDTPTKAVIKDIFYAVQQYVKTLDNQFLPIDNFIDVVTAQYKETQMPELALLKNKLLKYRDAEIFANTAEEYSILEEKLKARNCVVIDLKDVSGALQKEIMAYVHRILESYDKYVYYFVPLADDNSDKKLIKQFINHNHIFTTFFASHTYKYAEELKAHAQEVVFFSPLTLRHDFAAYNTFLNKLNPTEGVIYGRLTQNIPLIIDLEDLELDLTKEDVFGDRERFIPAIEEDFTEPVPKGNVQNFMEETGTYIDEKQNFESSDINTSNEFETTEDIIPEDIEDADLDGFGDDYTSNEPEPNEDAIEDFATESEIQDNENNDNIEDLNSYTSDDTDTTEDVITTTDEFEDEASEINNDIQEENSEYETDNDEQNTNQIENILAEETEESDNIEIEDDKPQSNNDTSDDNLDFMDDFVSEEEQENEVEQNEDISNVSDELTEDDLDFIENNQEEASEKESPQYDEDDFPEEENDEQPPMVPVFDTEDEEIEDISGEDIGYTAGDEVSHPRYGKGVVEKIIKYGNKTLCSINFENVGRRLLDPSVSEFEKI